MSLLAMAIHYSSYKVMIVIVAEHHVIILVSFPGVWTMLPIVDGEHEHMIVVCAVRERSAD